MGEFPCTLRGRKVREPMGGRKVREPMGGRDGGRELMGAVDPGAVGDRPGPRRPRDEADVDETRQL